MNSDTKNKRKRTPNYTSQEKDLLIYLALKYKTIIENKKTDAVTCAEKEHAWKSLTNEFNANSTVYREWVNLRTAYDNLKRCAKKKASAEPDSNNGEDNFLALLGKTAVPLPNQFDSDAKYDDEQFRGEDAKDGTEENGKDHQGSPPYFMPLESSLEIGEGQATYCDMTGPGGDGEQTEQQASHSRAVFSPQKSALLQPPVDEARPNLRGRMKWQCRRRPLAPPASGNPSGGEQQTAIKEYANQKRMYYGELLKCLRADEARKVAEEERRKELIMRCVNAGSDNKYKRKRTPNYTSAEKDLLICLALKYKNIIENKKTDAVTSAAKDRAWKALASEFNANSSFYRREAVNLRTAYDTLKRCARKKAAAEPDSVNGEENFLALLGKTDILLPSQFDSDGKYDDEHLRTDDGKDATENDKEMQGSPPYCMPLESSLEIGEAQGPYCETGDPGGEGEMMDQASHSRLTHSQEPRLHTSPLDEVRSSVRPKVKWQCRSRPAAGAPGYMPDGETQVVIKDYATQKRLYYAELLECLRADEVRKNAEEERKKNLHTALLTLLKAKTDYYTSATLQK